MQKIKERKASSILVFIWLVLHALAHRTDIELLLCGKGINVIGIEYWRFLTAGFVQTNPIHTLGNVYLISWLGMKYEKEIGSLHFFFVGFIGSAITYALYSLIYSNAVECVGGSGYWYALAGYILIRQLRVPGFTRVGQRWMLIYALVFLPIVPIIPGMNMGTAVFHVIAFVVGVGMGFLQFEMRKR